MALLPAFSLQELQGCALVFTEGANSPTPSAQLWGLGQAGCSHLVVLVAGGRILAFLARVVLSASLWSPQSMPVPSSAFPVSAAKAPGAALGRAGKKQPRFLRDAERNIVGSLGIRGGM